jgi:zinc transport system substrate-binding protein
MIIPSLASADPIPVFVSIAPQKYFVQQIGKDRVDVRVMVPIGASPATYEPKPRQMAALSSARLYFAIGVPFEAAWLDKIQAANPGMQIVHTEAGIEKHPMDAHQHAEKQDHSPKDEHLHESDAHAHKAEHHAHGVLDPHIWLSPPLVKLQAAAIRNALREVDPSHRADYEAHFRQFAASLDALDAELRASFADKQGQAFMVFHPAWSYFARTYGLQQVPIEIEGKDPKPVQLKELIQHARQNDIRVLFVQPQFSSRSAEMIAREIGGRVVVADPLAENWMANLREVADKFQSALQ